MEELQKKIQDCIIEDLDDFEVADMWNRYCDIEKYPDDIIYSMDSLATVFPEDRYTVSEALGLFDLRNFSDMDAFFYYTIYGIRSAHDIADCDCYCEEDMIRYIIDNQNSLGNDDIQTILEEYADDETDE